MGIFNLKNIKKSSVYITPNFPVLETKRYKFSLISILTTVSIYTLFVVLLVIVLLLFTPARNVVFYFENDKLNQQIEEVKQLEGKVVFLTTQLEKLASTNERMKYAMILASTDSLDSTAAIYDSLRKVEKKPVKTGGSILTVVRDLVEKITNQDKDYFFVRPVDGVIVKKFQPERGHMGIDYGVKTNTPVIASADGLVTFAGFTAEFGYTLIISHGNDFISSYKHCESLIASERDFVRQGQTIALSGNTGHKSSGPHLHFELWKDGKPVDPNNYFINR